MPDALSEKNVECCVLSAIHVVCKWKERGVPGCHSGEEVGLHDATKDVGPYVGVYCFVGRVQAEGVVAGGADNIVYALDADPKLQWGKSLSCLGHHPHVDDGR
jgi:hypothetical protein